MAKANNRIRDLRRRPGKPHPQGCTCHACRGRKGGLAKGVKGLAALDKAKREEIRRQGGKARAEQAGRDGNGRFK